MINIEKLNDLMKIPISTKYNEDRATRLMSCDNPIKTIFIYQPYNITGDFDNKIKSCILLFSKLVNYILDNEGNIDRNNLLGIYDIAVLPTKEIIKNSILEIKNWYYLLKDITETKNLSNIYDKVNSLSIINYMTLTNFCGITDFSKNINNSKTLRRFMNFNEQTKRLSQKCMSISIYLEEVQNHKNYIETLYNIYIKYELTEYDFIPFILIFDIRKNINMLK